MSNLLVQNIKHTNNTTSMAIDTSGQVTIRGEGSATTTNLQQGLGKVWANVDSSTAARDSFNVSSLTDNSAGNTTVNINNDMGNANYTGSWYTTAYNTSNVGDFVNNLTGGFGGFTTGAYTTISHNGTSQVDSDRNFSTIFGDLA